MKKMLVILAALAMLAVSNLAMAANTDSKEVTVSMTIEKAVAISVSAATVNLGTFTDLTTSFLESNGQTVTVSSNNAATIDQSISETADDNVAFSATLTPGGGNATSAPVTVQAGTTTLAATYKAVRTNLTAAAPATYTATVTWTITANN